MTSNTTTITTSVSGSLTLKKSKNRKPSGPITNAFAKCPTGLRKAAEAETATGIIKVDREMLRSLAVRNLIGTSSTAEAG